MSDIVDCPVDFRKGVSKFGEFANAFRVRPEAGDEVFLDFCVYSAQEDKAEVVSRIRVQNSFLPIILERISGFMRELKGDVKYVVRGGQLRTTEGGVVTFPTKGDS